MRRLPLVVIVLALVTLLFAGCGQAQPAAPGAAQQGEVKATVLRVAEQTPPKGSKAEALKWFTQEVEKKTAGKVKFEIYWGESLLKAKEMLKGVQEGTADMGWITASYYPSDIPLWLYAGDSLVFARSMELQDFVKAGHTMYDEFPAFADQMAKWNQRMVGYYPYDYFDLYMKVPVNNLNDMKGKRIRTTGESKPKALEAVGVVPLFFTAAESYSALEKGTMDGILFPAEHAFGYSIYEVTKYLSRVYVSPSLAELTINLDTWKKLPKDVQDVMIQAGKEMAFYQADIMTKERDELYEKFKATGMKISEMPKEELNRWTSMPEVKALPDKWAADMEAKGAPGKKILARWQELVGPK